MSGRLSKAQCAKAADLATPEECQKFYELDRLQKLAVIFGEWAVVDDLARQGRKLTREILRREHDVRADG